MKRLLLSLTLALTPMTSFASNDVDEIVVEDDPYIGVQISLEEFQPMVYLSNVTDQLTPSKMVQNIDRLITTLAQSKTAKKDLFKNSDKKVTYLDNNSVFTVEKVLKTAVYKDNIPDEYTTYILKGKDGLTYALPDFELTNVSRVSLTKYEEGLIEEFKKQGNEARVVIYFKIPPLYKDKTPPYSQKDLNSVFDYFLDKIKNYDKSKVLLSERNFRLSMNIPISTLAYLISEFDDLYIEDIEVISQAAKAEQEQDYSRGVIRYNGPELKNWYQK